jgi:hypothetical protein
MRVLQASLASLLVVSAAAFAPASQHRAAWTTDLSAVSVETKREAPDAGWTPEWENRPGLTREEFMESDMSEPDRAGMWECPLTRWDYDGYVY